MATLAARNPDPGQFLSQAWPYLLGFAVLAFPTMATLSNQTWNSEAGAHGPVILATGGWLLWRQRKDLTLRAQPGSLIVSIAILCLSLASYVAGRVLDYISLEVGGLYGAGLAVFYSAFGYRAMLRNWFPLLYLGFAVPPPSVWVDSATLPLKGFVSLVATSILQVFGLPVDRAGVVIYIAQYQLLVQDACSGMNSLIGLSAISLLYVYLRRGASLVHSALLILLIVPVAIAANIIRIMVLILITYYFGDQWGQSFLHETAGLFLFVIALLLVFLLDEALNLALERRRQAA